MASTKESRRKKIKSRIRPKVSAALLPVRALAVFRSNRDMYVQLVDDTQGTTLAAASSREKGFTRSGNKVEQSKAVGAAYR
jgi:large subunit ribosomal protein L18